MARDLSDPRAKLERAQEHLSVLDAEVAAFYEGSGGEGKPYEIVSEFRPDTSQYVFTVKVLRKPPPLLGLLLGDFAHNLRAALDHLVCVLSTGTCETTQYPICSSSAEYVKREPTWLAGVAEGDKAIIEKTQPYHAGKRADDHFLSVINWLDNIDKHRMIHSAFGFLDDPGESGARALTFTPNRDAGTIRYRQIAKGKRIERDTDIVMLKLAPLGPNPDVNMHGQLSFTPAFGDRWLNGTKLPQLASGVENLLALF